MNSSEGVFGAYEPHVLLAGPDTLHFSADISISDAVRAKLDDEKELAQSAEMAKTAHCPEWLGAQVHPHGSRSGYAYMLEADDFSVKVLGKGIPHRLGLYVELRSHFLHTHRPIGVARAVPARRHCAGCVSSCSTTRR